MEMLAKNSPKKEELIEFSLSKSFFFCWGKFFAKFLLENYNFYMCEGFLMGKMAQNSPDFKIFSPICQIFAISSSSR